MADKLWPNWPGMDDSWLHIATVESFDIYKDDRDDQPVLVWGNGRANYIYVFLDENGFREENDDLYDPRKPPITPYVMCKIYELFPHLHGA